MAMESPMGCPFGFLRRVSKLLRRANDICDRSLNQRVCINIGNDVQTDMKPLVFFVVGGPGSKKGVFIDCLVSCFNFTYVSCYDQANRDKSQIENIFSRLLLEIKEKGSDRYLVDLMIQSRKSSFDSSCEASFEAFEKEYRIGAGIYLYTEGMHAFNHKSIPQGARSDEADELKSQKRASSFKSSIRHLLNYFKSLDKLISVDYSSASDTLIWKTAYKILSNVKVRATRCTHLLIVFHNEDFPKELFHDKSFQTMNLTNLVHNIPQPSLQDCLERVACMVDGGPLVHHRYVVDVRDTPLNQNEIDPPPKRCSVMFEEDMGEMKKDNISSGVSGTFKAFSSVANETFVFSRGLSDPLCMAIAHTLSSLRRGRV